MQRKIFLFHLLRRRILNRSCLQQIEGVLLTKTGGIRSFSGNEGDKQVKESRITKESSELELPEEPTNCCMSGCANCVWIEYAKELKTIFCCSGEKTREIILKKVEDPSMKAFLAMELKMMEKD